MTSEGTRKKSMGLRNNSMVVLWVGHLSVCQTIRDSWFQELSPIIEYSNYPRNEFPCTEKERQMFFKNLKDTRTTVRKKEKNLVSKI